MEIRDYEASDKNACVGLFMGNLPKFFDITELEGFNHWLDAYGAGIKAYESNEIEKFYVLELDDVIVACGGFCIPTENPAGNMVWGMVENALHKQGIGRYLLEYRIRKIKELRAGIPIILDTTQHSYIFFQKLGFGITKITPEYYGKGLDRYDMGM
jgi:ribosomal-protein-alanine N-acetyltransferase